MQGADRVVDGGNKYPTLNTVWRVNYLRGGFLNC